jgi:drug/metabolite transporter (DMT)-like permease
MRRTPVSAIVIVLFCTLLTSAGKTLWKFAAFRLPAVLTNVPLLLGFALYAIAAVILIQLFKKGEVSVLFPLYATSYIWVTLLAFFLFDEQLTLLKWAGIAAIIIGAALIGGEKHPHQEVISP